jgi:hypothetical protein
MPRTPFPLRQTHLICAALAAALGGGCGGGGEPAAVTLTPDAAARAASFQRTLELKPTGAGPVSGLSAPGPSTQAGASSLRASPGLLSGDAGMNAVTALHDYPEAAHVSGAATGTRPRFEADISPLAMVGQVNAALTAVGARIVATAAARGRVVLELTEAGSTQPIQTAVERLAYSRAFEPPAPLAPQIDDHVQPSAPVDASPPP